MCGCEVVTSAKNVGLCKIESTTSPIASPANPSVQCRKTKQNPYFDHPLCAWTSYVLALEVLDRVRDLDLVTVLVRRSVMIDVTWMVVVDSAVLLLELTLAMLLLLLESDEIGELGVVLIGTAALLMSGVAVLDASSDVELLLSVGNDVLGSGQLFIGVSVCFAHLAGTCSRCLVIVNVDVYCSVSCTVVLGRLLVLVLSMVTSVSRRSVFDRLMYSVVLLMYDVLESKIRAPGPERVFEKVTGKEVVTVDVTTTTSQTS